MCFNAKTSLGTFAISLICCCYLLYRGLKTKNKNDLFLSILTILIGSMQLIEFFLWSNQSCNDMNHYFSLLIILLLFLQGVISNLFYLKLYPNDAYFFSKDFIKIVLFMYSIFIIYVLYHLNSYNLCSKPSSKSCRLIWDSLVKFNYPENRLLYILFICFYFFMIAIILCNSVYSKNDLLTKYPLRYSFLFITFVIAQIYVFLTSNFNKEIYIFLQNFKIADLFKKIILLGSNDVFGSVWCFLCVFVGIVGILKI